MIKRFVILTIRTECIVDFLKMYNSEKNTIMAAHGCRHLELLNDINDPRLFITFSIWDSEDDFNAYRASQVFLKIWDEAGKMFDADPKAYSTKHLV